MYYIIQEYLEQMTTRVSTQPQPQDKEPQTVRRDIIEKLFESARDDNGDSFIDSYQNLKQEEKEIKQDYFKVLVQVIVFVAGQKQKREENILKQILAQLLTLEKDKNDFLDLVPQELFLEIKKYNVLTFERKIKKYLSNKATIRRQSWSEQSKGFAQLLLSMSRYFNDPNVQIDAFWQRLLLIVGKYNLDFCRVIDILLDHFAQCLSQEKVLSVARQLPKQKLKELLANKICPKPVDSCLQYCGSIQALLDISIQDCLWAQIISYNPAFVKVLLILVKGELFSLQQIEVMMPRTTAAFYKEFQEKQFALMEHKISKIDQNQLQENENNAIELEENKLLFGQINFCFKYALMYEYLKQNQFQEFLKIKGKVPNTKVNFIMFSPILRLLSDILQWSIDPFFDSYGSRNHFKKTARKIKVQQFPKGHFKQMKRLDLDTMESIQQVLACLDINIGFCMRVFVKLCRIFTLFLKDSGHLLSSKQDFELIKSKIGLIVQNYLIGGIEICNKNNVLVLQFEKLIFHFNGNQRFSFYSFYISNVLYESPHLIAQFQKVNDLNTRLNKTSYSQTNKSSWKLLLEEYNHVFRSSFYIALRVPSLDKNIPFQWVDIVSSSSLFHKDVMLYYVLEYLISKEESLMMSFEFKDPSYSTVIKFIHGIYKQNYELDYSMLFEFVLRRLNQKIQEPSSAEQVVICYNRNLVFAKIIAYQLQEMCPNLADCLPRDDVEKYEFLSYGYYLQLHLSGNNTMQRFLSHRHCRRAFYWGLCKRRSNGNTYIFEFLKAISSYLSELNNYNIRHQEGASIVLQKHGISIDECTLLLSQIIRVFCLQYALVYEEKYKVDRISRKQELDQKYKPSPIVMPRDLDVQDYKFPITIEELFKLRGTYGLQLKYISTLLRTFYKFQLRDIRVASVKSIWKELVSIQCQESGQGGRVHQLWISQSKVRNFKNSDLFFNFWMAQNAQIIPLQIKYCSKITEMKRARASEVDHTPKLRNEAQQKAHERKLGNQREIISRIQDEKEDLTSAYQIFNYIHSGTNQSNRQDRVNKFKVPSEFSCFNDKKNDKLDKQRIDQVFKQFLSQFLSTCLLPRMLMDPSDAVYASKFLLKVIKENKIRSNQALMMVFYIVEWTTDCVQFSTQKEITKGIAVFVNDLLRLFKNWNSFNECSAVLLQEINVQKFTQNRYQTLKSKIYDTLCNLNKRLIVRERESYVIRNTINFIEKTNLLPMCYEQGEELLRYFKQIEQQCPQQDEAYKIKLTRLIELIEMRKRVVPTLKTVKAIKRAKEDAEAEKTNKNIQMNVGKKNFERFLKKNKTQDVGKDAIVIDDD